MYSLNGRAGLQHAGAGRNSAHFRDRLLAAHTVAAESQQNAICGEQGRLNRSAMESHAHSQTRVISNSEGTVFRQTRSYFYCRKLVHRIRTILEETTQKSPRCTNTNREVSDVLKKREAV